MQQQPPSEDLFRNPYILGAIGFILLFFLIVGVVVLRPSGASSQDGEPTKTATQNTSSSPIVGDRFTVKLTTTINVRTGPGGGYPVIGTIRNGTEVPAVGRTADDKWLKIVYPPNSNPELYGWIDARWVTAEGGFSSLPVVAADVPTAGPTTKPQDTPDAGTPTATATVTVTPTPVADLIIASASTAGGKLVATVKNTGKVAVENKTVKVGVFDQQGQTLLRTGSASVTKLDPGATVNVDTTYTCAAQPASVLIIVDYDSQIPESDDANNSLSYQVPACGGDSNPTATPGGGAPTATPPNAGSVTPTPTISLPPT